ncbi:hypothetical protein VTO42DRAFT_2908 [Malbranchea cinnamomea]
MSNSGKNGNVSAIDKRDFDAHRPLLTQQDGRGDSRPVSRGEEDGRRLLNDVVDELVERDRMLMKREITRLTSFVWAVLSASCAGSITAFSLYGPLFLTRLHYSQFRVNAVAVAAEFAMYLPVPLFGYLCDRYTTSPVALLSGFLFGAGYLFAALAYKSGPPRDAGGDGWPFAVMVLAFVGVGSGTASMYLSAVATCAKNFGRSKYKGFMLAMPIAAFGLSGMWQSQIGRHLLCERLPDGRKGEVDIFKYFLFLAILLFVVGVGGTFALKIVDEEEIINEAVEELERSGYLDDGSFSQPREDGVETLSSYGTFDAHARNGVDDDLEGNTAGQEALLGVEKKKTWLLNNETRMFLKDQTMWWLAVGFFLVTGPGEAYINNFGTILHTLSSPSQTPEATTPPGGLPSTHVTIIALTSTIARLLTGFLSDLFAPTTTSIHPQHPNSASPPFSSSRLTLSRLTLLLPSALILSLGYLLLFSPLSQSHPTVFHAITALVGFGYGASFSLIPLIISVVWGVENFGTNWGIVATAPAIGATVWGLIYSAGYEGASRHQDHDGQCYGWRCYGFWALGCTISVWVAIVSWVVAWRMWRKRGVVV